MRPSTAAIAVVAAAVALAACGTDGAVTVDPDPDPGAGGGDALAVACDTLEGQPYRPPADQQPDADPALTGAEAVPDLPTETDEAADGGLTAPAPQDPIGAVRAWAEREAADHFAGLWFDSDHGATVVAFTEDVDRYAAEVRERFGAGWWVVEHEHSQAELRAVLDRLTAEDMGGWDGDQAGPGDIWGAGTRDTINRVTVSIVDPDEARVAELSERYGADRICLEVEPVRTAADAVPAPWEPAPDADLSPDSTAIDVLVNERSCASGQPADGRIPPPEVSYDEDHVVIAIGVIPVQGGARCPGNPDTVHTIVLDEPLGDRTLLDGREDPPAAPTLDDDDR